MYHVYPKAYTQPLYHSAYIDIFEIISAIINIKYDKDVWYFMKKPFGAPIKDAC